MFGTQLVGTYFDESMLGEYWCLVIVTSTQPNIYLGKSDILVIRDPENYDTGLQRCQGIISVPTSKCADGIVTSQISEAFTSSFSSSSSSFSFPLITCSNSLTTYSSIQIDSPSNSLSKSDDSGLISFHIVIIIVTLIIMILGILSIVSCLVIICIKKNKKPEDTRYHGESLIIL